MVERLRFALLCLLLAAPAIASAQMTYTISIPAGGPFPPATASGSSQQSACEAFMAVVAPRYASNPSCSPTSAVGAGGTCTLIRPCNGNDSFTITSEAVPCTEGELASSGYFDIGPNSSAHPRMSACINGCTASFDGISPAGSALVDGVRHFFASGSYHKTGGFCTLSPNTDPGPPAPELPAPDCAEGQVLGELNGRPVCADGGGAGGPTPETPPGPTPESDPTRETTTTTTTTGPAPGGGTETTEVTTVTRGDGSSETTTTTTTTNPDGTITTGTETTRTPPVPGSNTDEPDDPDDPDDPDADPCRDNPSAAGCGGVATGAASSYTKKSKTFADVLNASRNTLMASPLGSALGGFFTINATGSCPTWTANVAFLDVSIDFDHLCTSMALDAWAVLGWCLVLVGAFFAFRVAIE